MALRGAIRDEAISFSGKDCFAEFILSAVEGFAMTCSRECADTLLKNLLTQHFPLSIDLVQDRHAGAEIEIQYLFPRELVEMHDD